jgi:hypothetical protein
MIAEKEKLEKPQKLFWTVQDVMRELAVSKPTAYRIMDKSGCVAPISRRKRVSVKRFMAYLENTEANN